MAIGITNFPTALDTASTLVEATNNASTTLTGAITNSQNTIPIADPGEFPDTGFATIVDSLTSPTKLEIISYTGKSGSDLTGVTRGAQGTSGTAFDSGNFVELRYTKGMHEALRGAIVAIETKLGYGSDTAANGQVLIGNGAGTSEWRALIAGDIPDLSGTYATAGHNHSGVYQPVDADLTAIAALSNDGFLKKTGGTWGMDSTAYGTGTVTSVALSLPAIFTVSGSPVTTSGTLAGALADQAANVVLAGPTTGAATTPTFRALVAADIPSVLSVTKLSNLTSNGFVKTGSGDGTLSVDTSTYLTANQTVTLSGDVTGSGSTAITATIASAAVTYAKMQNVSAQYRIWARKSASAGSVEECTLSEVLDFVTNAAQGDILYRGASGWDRLGAGTSGYFLQTQGAGANPQWAAASGSGTPGGSDKQVQFNNSSAFGGAAGFEYQSGASPNVSITAQNAAYVPLYVNGASSQTANLQQWAVNSTVYNVITKDGYLYLGRGETSATPVTGRIYATGGSGTNIGGASLTLYGGAGTGTGTGGSIAFYTAAAGGSGSTPNTPVIQYEIDQKGNHFFGNAQLVQAATDGFVSIPEIANVPSGVPTVVAGLAPMAIDATNYRLYAYVNSGWRNLTGAASGITVGTTTITSGTAGRVLYETSGNVVGEIAGSSVDANGAVQWAATARTSGVASYYRINTPADTGLTASTESVGVYFGGNGSGSTVTRTWATGAITTQRENVFVAPTYAFASASTLGTAATVAITGAPVAGANATITNSFALHLTGRSSGGNYLPAMRIEHNGALWGGIEMRNNNDSGPVWTISPTGLQVDSYGFVIATGTTRYMTFYSDRASNGLSINSVVKIADGSNITSAQLHVISQSASRVALRVDSAANSTVALNQFYLDADDTATVAPHSVFAVDSNGSVAAGFGGQLQLQLESSTTAKQDAAAINWLWTDHTHATRTAALSFSTVENAGSLTERARITFDGTRSHFIIGNGGNVASPVGGLVQATSGLDGSNNVNGADLILAGGQPTGSGTPGQVLRKYSLQGASGTTLRALSSNNYNIPSVMFTATADAAVTNTTSETTIIGSGVGTTTVEAGMWRVGRTIRVRVTGYLTTTSTPTLQIRFKLGSTTVADTGAVTLSSSISGNEFFEALIDITCRSIGATGTVFGNGIFIYHLGSGTANMDALEAFNTAAVTVDTTAAQAVNITAQWGTANPNNSIVGTTTTIEILN